MKNSTETFTVTENENGTFRVRGFRNNVDNFGTGTFHNVNFLSVSFPTQEAANQFVSTR